MVPLRFYSGETVQFTISGKAGQNLKIIFRGPENFEYLASDVGADARFSFTKSVSTYGKYLYQIISDVAGYKTVVYAGECEIQEGFHTSTPTGPIETKSQAELDLIAVKAAMRAIISGGAVKSYSIAGRSLTKMDMADLIMLETKLKVEVGREKKLKNKRLGLSNPHMLKVRFR